MSWILVAAALVQSGCDGSDLVGDGGGQSSPSSPAVDASPDLADPQPEAGLRVVRKLAQYVDPRVGVLGAGSNVIGPAVPHGSIHPSPHTPDGGTDGYDPASPVIRGFGQLHVSGTGGNSKYGNILVSPQAGTLSFGETEHDFTKSEERASACEYAVSLESPGGSIHTEVVPAHNAAMYRFTYPANENSFIAFDVSHHIPRDILGDTGALSLAGAHVTVDALEGTVTGMGKYRGGWAGDEYTVYFAAQISVPPDAVGTWKNDEIADSATMTANADGERIGAFFRFATAAQEQVLLKVAVSLQSIANAEAMLAEQIPYLDEPQLDVARLLCESAWHRALSAILIDDPTATTEQLTLFYTNLHRSLLMPRNRTGDEPSGAPGPYYDDHYADWDTFRSTFPLLTLIQEATMADIIGSYIGRFGRHGVVHDAFVAGADTWIQGGDAVDVAIADAYVKGVSGVDWDAAYEILRFNAENMRSVGYRANDRGFVANGDALPVPSPGGSAASKTLEFALNDFAVSQVAAGLGHVEDHARFSARSTRWDALWRAEATDHGYTGFVNPRTASGAWEDIDLQQGYSGWEAGNFYEGSSWLYSFFVPHDVAGLVSRMGGKETFVNRLDFGFDSSLLIVNNEPGFLVPWLYIYGGRPDLSSARVRSVMRDWTLRGYPGDEDSGALGAWYVFAAMGMFPNAGQDLYLLHGPRFRSMTIQRDDGARIVIEGPDAAAADDQYIQSATLDGAPVTRPWLTHSELKDGAVLSFVMGSTPSAWGSDEPPPTPQASLGGGQAATNNLALGKTGSSTAPCGEGEQAAAALDGSTTSKWCSQVQGDKWLSVDLGAEHSVSRWVVRHGASGNEPRRWNTSAFKLQASTDNATWTDVDVVVDNTRDITDRSFPPVTARFLRLVITAPTNDVDNAARIYELEIY